MAYKLSSDITPQANVVEVADFWEMECLRKADFSASIMDIKKTMGIMDDEQEDDDPEQEIQLEIFYTDVVNEIERRANNCNGKYPFFLDKNGYVLELDGKADVCFSWIYLYCLLATRNNMGGNRMVDNIDGTKLFEKLGKVVLVNNLGKNADGMVFGTAAEGTFYERLNKLVTNLNEGMTAPQNVDLTYNPQDDKLDVVAWVAFADKQPSQLICFAQCKTGDNWSNHTKQLRSDDFLTKWFYERPALTPVDSFMVVDAVDHNDFFHRAATNLFFDRCRLINYASCPKGNDWFDNMRHWTIGIMKQFDLNMRPALMI